MPSGRRCGIIYKRGANVLFEDNFRDRAKFEENWTAFTDNPRQRPEGLSHRGEPCDFGRGARHQHDQGGALYCPLEHRGDRQQAGFSVWPVRGLHADRAWPGRGQRVLADLATAADRRHRGYVRDRYRGNLLSFLDPLSTLHCRHNLDKHIDRYETSETTMLSSQRIWRTDFHDYSILWTPSTLDLLSGRRGLQDDRNEGDGYRPGQFAAFHGAGRGIRRQSARRSPGIDDECDACAGARALGLASRSAGREAGGRGAGCQSGPCSVHAAARSAVGRRRSSALRIAGGSKAAPFGATSIPGGTI